MRKIGGHIVKQIYQTPFLYIKPHLGYIVIRHQFSVATEQAVYLSWLVFPEIFTMKTKVDSK